MNNTKRTISKLLVVFADALDSMDDSEFDSLIQGKGKLSFVSVETNGQKPVTVKPLVKPEAEARLQAEVSETAQKLFDADSRETAENLIASIKIPKGRGRKDFLIRLAKACTVHVESKDAIARIEQKLVEGTVGAKLRSKALREVTL